MVNTLSFTDKKRVRKNFGKLKEVSKFPNLIEIQKNSYDEFLLENENPSSREDRGLQKVFKSVFPLVEDTHHSLLTTDLSFILELLMLLEFVLCLRELKWLCLEIILQWKLR